MKLTDCVSLFLTRYLPDIRGASRNTIVCYKNTFRLFIPYASRYLSKKFARIDVADMSTDLVIDFLDHVENEAGNHIRTRNNRLARISHESDLPQMPGAGHEAVVVYRECPATQQLR